MVNGVRVTRTSRAVDLAPMAIAFEDCQSGAFPERGAENAARSTHIAANLTDSDSASLDTPRIHSERRAGSQEVAIQKTHGVASFRAAFLALTRSSTAAARGLRCRIVAALVARSGASPPLIAAGARSSLE